jgi:predicted GIY-YIG superfamily endonuclease
MSFWVYMPRWMDDSFYVGHTDNLEARVAHHQTGDYPSYALKRRPVVLVYSQEFTSREEALSAERQIKAGAEPRSKH